MVQDEEGGEKKGHRECSVYHQSPLPHTNHSNDGQLLLASLLNVQGMRMQDFLSEAQRKHTRAWREEVHPVPEQSHRAATLLPPRKQQFPLPRMGIQHTWAQVQAGGPCSGRKKQQQATKTPDWLREGSPLRIKASNKEIKKNFIKSYCLGCT